MILGDVSWSHRRLGSIKIGRNHPPIEYLSCDHIKVSVDAKDLSTSDTELVTMSEVTNISVTWKTHTRLSEIGRKGETFNHIVERLLDACERAK